MKRFFCVVVVLLCLTFLAGGGASDRGLLDALAQLLALPVLVWSIYLLSREHRGRCVWWAAGIAAAIVLVVALQLLPLPLALWRASAVRASLSDDLALAGVAVHPFWSLSPWETERALWSMLPALALFTAALVLDAQRQRRLLQIIVMLVLFSAVLGYLQLAAPQDSLLNPFPQWAPALGGVFANSNHQATAIGIALVLVLASLLEMPRQARRALRTRRLVHVLVGGFLLVTLPLAGSRAMVLLVPLALLAVVLLDGSFMRGLGVARTSRVLLGAGLGLILPFVMWIAWIGLQWMRVDALHESRRALAQATVSLGARLSPLGAGVGSFVPWFAQAAPVRFLGREYINHAHNEYAQWWLESGVLGVAVLLAVLILLVWIGPRQGRHRPQAIAIGSWVAVCLVLAHSAVDYPLRTPALMTVTAALLAVSVSVATGRRDSPESGALLVGDARNAKRRTFASKTAGYTSD